MVATVTLCTVYGRGVRYYALSSNIRLTLFIGFTSLPLSEEVPQDHSHYTNVVNYYRNLFYYYRTVWAIIY